MAVPVGEIRSLKRGAQRLPCALQGSRENIRKSLRQCCFLCGPYKIIFALGLSAASKLRIDQKLFQTINSLIAFLQKIDPYIPDQLRSDPLYQALFAQHKKIDALTVITAHFPDDRASAGDFSHETIESRIKLGYEQAKRQHIGTPHPVE